MHVDNLAIVMMCVSMICGAVLFALPFVIFKFKFKYKGLPVLFGAATMFVFALCLEPILHNIVLLSPAGKTIQNNIWLYGLYGALAAATFEEVGRFITMKFVMKKYHGDKTNSIMYGVGHGGFEAAYILIVGMVSNLLLAALINSGNTDILYKGLSEDMASQVTAQLEALCATSAVMFLLGIVERIWAIIAQISMSVVMWRCASLGDKRYFALAFLMHFVLDFVTVVINGYFGIAVTEGCLAFFVLLLALLARKVYTHED